MFHTAMFHDPSVELLSDMVIPSSNTITLDKLLAGANLQFRTAVIKALEKEGFELYDSHPRLQHPIEILHAIQNLDSVGFGLAWDSLHQAILVADKFGVLVDLSLPEVHTFQLASALLAAKQ